MTGQMQFTYFYKTSDGVRCQGEIDAPTRDEAFAALRKQGIRAIKVVAKNPGLGIREYGYGKRTIALFSFVAAILAGGAVFLLSGYSRDREPHKPDASRQERKTHTVSIEEPQPHTASRQEAKPIRPYSRRQLPKVSQNMLAAAFNRRSEMFLTRYAVPGVLPPDGVDVDEALETDFIDAMDVPIFFLPDDTKEIRDWKRVIVGLKNEVEQSFNSGKTIYEIITVFETRQKMEANYRRDALQELQSLKMTPNYLPRLKLFNQIFDAMGLELIPEEETIPEVTVQ